MSDFSKNIPRSNEEYSFLPALHTCDGISARHYIRSKKIITEEICEVFDERITYFFYGRAAYKYQLKDESTTRLDLYPVCFVFDLELIDNIKRIYPFDTGSKHHGLLDGFINPKISLMNFEIEPETRRIGDVVVKFFGDNDSYLAGRVQNFKVDPLDFESTAYLEMTRSYVAQRADERRVTIEIQADEVVPFSGGALQGVVAPIQYMESPLFKAFLEDTRISVKTYSIDVWNPKHSFSVLASKAKEFTNWNQSDV